MLSPLPPTRSREVSSASGVSGVSEVSGAGNVRRVNRVIGMGTNPCCSQRQVVHKCMLPRVPRSWAPGKAPSTDPPEQPRIKDPNGARESNLLAPIFLCLMRTKKRSGLSRGAESVPSRVPKGKAHGATWISSAAIYAVVIDSSNSANSANSAKKSPATRTGDFLYQSALA